MRESRTYGSVRGAESNLRPYRERVGTFPLRKDRQREGDMLSGITVLFVSLGVLAAIWVFVLIGSRPFGSPPEH